MSTAITTQLNQVFTLFLCLFLQALPFLLLGIIISSWLLVFVNQRQLLARLPRNPLLEVLLGSCMGLFLPVCQYGNIPLARRLLIQRVPVPLVVSFLLAAPTINPLVIWLTIIAFPQEPEIVFWRVVFAWLTAIIVGCIFISYQGKRSLPAFDNINLEPNPLLLKTGTFLPIINANQPLLIGSKIHVSNPEVQSLKNEDSRLYLFLDNLIRELLELGCFLIIGSIISATIQVFFLKTDLLLWGGNNFAKIFSAMLFGSVSSLGSTIDTLTITNLREVLTNGSMIALLLFGSFFDIKSLVLMLATFRYKEVIYLFILTFQLVSFFSIPL
jgi:uncharacterized membrane protein YraQ (UPF0718 family)